MYKKNFQLKIFGHKNPEPGSRSEIGIRIRN
jgi:hypothetical protein